MNPIKHSYDLLGVRHGAPFKDVRHAYLRLVREWHPDRFPDDPQRQRLAQERLKVIIEAYRVLEKALSGERESPGAEVMPASPAPGEGSGARPGASRAQGGARGIESNGLIRFLSFWPNVLFLAYLLFTGRMAVGRGDLLYFLQMSIVPLIFAVLCNSRLGGRQGLWKAYVAAICIFAVLLAADASMVRRGVRDTWIPRSPDSGEATAPSVKGPFGGALPEPQPGEFERRAPGGLREVAPPTPPSAPETPIPPEAPAAPVVPKGR